MKTRTMFEVMRALEKELGASEGLAIYEWYCQTYNVNAGDDAPATIVWEVFGE